MIIGEYPCCGEPLQISTPDDLNYPLWEREACPHCGEIVWHYLNRLAPESVVESDFLKRCEVDPETGKVRFLDGQNQ